jgi:hypothetical protein
MGDGTSLLRRTLLVLCIFTAVAGAWLCVMENILRHAGYGTRTLVDAGFVLQSLLTVACLFGGGRGMLRWFVALGGVAVLYLGAAACVQNLRGAHFEGFAAVIGAALVLQGALTMLVVPAWFVKQTSAA